MRGDLATWCRILAVGPPCEHACPDCRARPITMTTIRNLTPESPMAEIDPDAEPVGESDPIADRDSYPVEPGLVGAVPAHLITWGFTPRLRELTADLEATHVDINLTGDIDVSHHVLALVDAASLYDACVVAVGPLAFGWATTGRLRDLRDWGAMRAPDVRVVICPDEEESETYVQASDAYMRLGASCGLLVSHEIGLGWLRAATQVPTS